MFRILIVGAGFAGAVMAERLAGAGHHVTIVDTRPHIAGNAFDEYDSNGILVHRYGPHIFHTNADWVYEYLSKFTSWRLYEHRVKCSVDGRLFPFPINRKTLEMVYGGPLTSEDAEQLIERIREPQQAVENSEQLVLNSVGRKLYEMFFFGYTSKQWGRPPSTLSSGVAARIPIRTNDDDRYFTDRHQSMPALGYTHMFGNLLDHPRIDVRLNMMFARQDAKTFDHLVYTGPVDSFFEHKLGKLPYRSLRFEHEHLAKVNEFQTVGTVNFPNDHSYTRITEFKHLTGQTISGTSIVREYPSATGDPYYPVPAPENERLFKQYAAMAEDEPNVTFIGRLAQYRYYNMDQVVAAALTAAQKFGAERPLTASEQ